MKTIILNGSPKGNSEKSNTRIFAQEFVRNMQNPCEIRTIAAADYQELTRYIQGFDSVIIMLPLYIHAMPGIVMKFIEMLEPAETDDKYMGFIVQAGFIESSQHRFIEPYFKALAKQLNCNYLGTVSKGEAAGIYMYPNMFKKVFRLLNDLGSTYEQTHTFDTEIVKELATPYELSPFKLGLLTVVNKIGLGNVGWHTMLRKNNAFEKRLDRPFL